MTRCPGFSLNSNFSLYLKAGPLKKNGPMQITVKDLLTVKLKKTQSLDERRKVRNL